MNAAELHKARFPDGEWRAHDYWVHERGGWKKTPYSGLTDEACDSLALQKLIHSAGMPTEILRSNGWQDYHKGELLWRRIDWPPGSPKYVKPLNVKTYYGPAGAV